MCSPTQLLLIVPKSSIKTLDEPDDSVRYLDVIDRGGGVPHGNAHLTLLNLSGLEAKPVEANTFVDNLLTPITRAMEAMQTKFKGLTIEEIKISLAVTAEGNIGIASAGVESSIEVTLKWHEVAP